MSILTSAELAAQLRVSERTVARMLADGCPSLLVGRRRRFDLAAVLSWAQTRASEESSRCPSDKTPLGAGMPRLASAAADFTDAYRRVQLRAMPGSSKPS